MALSTLGGQGESLIENEYRKKGYKIVARNFKALAYKQLGEIDIIASKGRELVFVEVKTRSNTDFMDPLESVGFRKQRKLLRAIKAFLSLNRDYDSFKARVDVGIVESALDGTASKLYIVEDVIQDIS